MSNANQIKVDVTNECQNQLYYNQLDVQRLIENPAGYSHKQVVDRVMHLLERNVILSSSIQLLGQYLPAQKESQPSAEPELVPTETV